MTHANTELRDPRLDELSSRRGLARLRWLTLRNTVVSKLSGSRFRLGMILGCSVVFWVGLFLVFFDGFRFLGHHRMISGLILEMLFGLFFASLFVMLVFSTGIILYASLFASGEAEQMLVQPIGTDRVFAHKFIGAMFFSCWGFLLLGSPLMMAHGLTSKAAWYFYPLAVAFFLAFATIPGCIGAIACLLVVNYLPRRRREALVSMAVVVLLGVGIVGYRLYRVSVGRSLTRDWVNNVIEQLGVSQLPFWPSQWISTGLLRATYPDGLSDACFYLLVLTSNALFLYLIAARLHQSLYRRGYDRAHSMGYSRRRPTGSLLPRFIDRVFSPLPRGVRALIVKDIRIFTRDPLQWSQVLIFTGLLVFYFLNLGKMTYYTSSIYWRNLIGFFNLAVTGLLLSTFTSRFVYPLLSLEGQKFWILGLCPISRETILWGKFAFAATGSVMVTTVLTLLGGYMLELEPYLVALQILTVLILCFGVAGIAVGLGAKFPEMKETDPSKIAAGFGGTLNLVASLIYILIVIGIMALPCHLYSLTEAVAQNSPDVELLGKPMATLTLPQFRFWLGVSMFASLTVGVMATFLPMRMGIRAFRNMEF
ncbi:MAG: hypothetical protein U1D30_21350 [Planctomycetota bacterium]